MSLPGHSPAYSLFKHPPVKFNSARRGDDRCYSVSQFGLLLQRLGNLTPGVHSHTSPKRIVLAKFYVATHYFLRVSTIYKRLLIVDSIV